MKNGPSLFTQVPGSGILGSTHAAAWIKARNTEVQDLQGARLLPLATSYYPTLDKDATGRITPEYTPGRAMGWRREVREMISQLEEQRARLEQVKLRARRQGGPEGERLEAQTEARLQDIEERIKGLRDSLE